MATDEHAVEVFTDKFSAIIPGKAKGFKLSELEAAKAWIAAED